MLVHHDDAQREHAYGPSGGLPDIRVGTFGGIEDRWSVVSIKNDRKRGFAFK
jgi:hypothetical protein